MQALALTVAAANLHGVTPLKALRGGLAAGSANGQFSPALNRRKPSRIEADRDILIQLRPYPTPIHIFHPCRALSDSDRPLGRRGIRSIRYQTKNCIQIERTRQLFSSSTESGRKRSKCSKLQLTNPPLTKWMTTCIIFRYRRPIGRKSAL
jgi:hypothetical protein